MKLTRIIFLLFFAPGCLQAAVVSPNTNLTERELQIVAASKIEAAPRINGARVIGIRPQTPLLHLLACSGARPMTLSVSGLPDGLKFDSQSGIVTGSLPAAGEYKFKVRAENATGKAESEVRIICGDAVALTPPMGWNSYDAYGDSVVESEVLANAAWLKEHLAHVGWDTVVVDFRWYDARADGIRHQNPEAVTIDEFGRCIPPTNRFPSAADGKGFKSLADKIHAMGLKFGIHIMRGIPRKAVQADLPVHGTNFKASEAARPEGDPYRECRWNQDMYGVDASSPAGKAWYSDIAKQYAEWGVDYVKCDDIANLERGANRYPELEVEALSQGLKASGRSIVLSLSPGPALVPKGPHLEKFANLWRISGDFWDRWEALNRNFDLFSNWLPINGPGHWADGDMIPFGHVCQRNCDVKPDHWTRFSRDEQLILMSLWALTPSPLMLGMNMTDNDAWTEAIISNPEVLAVNQDSLGLAARRVSSFPAGPETWVKALQDGSSAIGFFNRTAQPLNVKVSWRQLGLPSTPEVRDLWLRKNLGPAEDFAAELPPHGCILLQAK